MYVQHEPESRVCQRIGSCETDFAISTKIGQEPDYGLTIDVVCEHTCRCLRAITVSGESRSAKAAVRGPSAGSPGA
jgi:hypothetical protein